MAATPTINSFLFADQVFQQKGGKWCIIGVFDKIFCHDFPIVHPSFGMFFALSGTEGRYDIRVEFQNSAGQTLAIHAGKLTVRDRLERVNFGVQTHILPLPRPGRYIFKVFFNEVFVMDLPIDVFKIGEKR